MDNVEYIKYNLNIIELVKQLGIKIYPGDFISSIYHTEKTPSLKLYKNTNSFYDFSTGNGGDVIKFYADYHNISNSEAIIQIINQFYNGYTNYKSNTVVKQKQQKAKNDLNIDELYLTNKEKEIYTTSGFDALKLFRTNNIIRVYFTILHECAIYNDKEVIDYLLQRNISKKIIQKYSLFRIKQDTIEILQKYHTLEEIKIAGLINEKGNFIFANHPLIIPYFNSDGLPIYLKGRILSNTSEKTNKYMFPKKDTLNILTSKIIYNQYDFFYPYDYLFLCEGEMDCLAALSHFYYKVSAIPGINAFNNNMLEYLKKPKKVILTLDNDEAGKKATQKIAKLFDDNQIRYEIFDLGDYKDLNDWLLNNNPVDSGYIIEIDNN